MINTVYVSYNLVSWFLLLKLVIIQPF